MDKPISVGDLVVIVHGCCDRARQAAIGVHATVLRFFDDPGHICCFCESPIPTKRAELDHQKWNSPVPWLKRIPPLEELGQLTTEQWMEKYANV